jgi:hypothetical protein
MNPKNEPKAKKPEQSSAIDDDDIGDGLTDDERVSRESEPASEAKVTLGPADLERLPKSQQESE